MVFKTQRGGLSKKIPEHHPIDGDKIDQVVLFSGGMDSTCGLASICEDAPQTRLVSFYTQQKALQRKIASDIKFNAPIQWRMNWKGKPGRGRSFHYRSFLFLCLVAAVAESWGIKSISQFENGILALAIPPSPSWAITKHAHPLLHVKVSRLFSALFGENGISRILFCSKQSVDVSRRQ